MPLLQSLCCLALLSAFCLAETDPLAGRGGSYLRLGIGGRAQAMGNAQAAVLEPTTVFAYWNPAMAAQMTTGHAAAGGLRFMTLDREEGYLSFSTKIPPRAGFSVALLYHGDRAIPLFDSDGNYQEEGGYLALTAHISVAYRLTRKLSLGLNTTLHQVSLSAGTEEGDNMSKLEAGNLDLSAFYLFSKSLSFGLNIKEIQSNLNWAAPTYGTEFNTTLPDYIPLDIKAGIAYRRTLYGRNFLAAYDLDLYLIPVNVDSLSFFSRLSEGTQKIEHHVGMEYFLYPEFPLRAGFGSNEYFSLGCGFYFLDGRFKSLKLDYTLTMEQNGSGLNNGVSWTCSW